MKEFQLSKFTKEGEELLRGVTEEFNRLGIDSSRLPKTFPDDSGKIKLVFVGQYSAVKTLQSVRISRRKIRLLTSGTAWKVSTRREFIRNCAPTTTK